MGCGWPRSWCSSPGARPRRDPGWADYARPRLSGAAPDGTLRAVALDGAPADEVIALFFTLSRDPGTSGDDLADTMRREFTEQGRAVAEAHAVRVNGADGAYAEFTIAAGSQGSPEPRVGMQVRIPDPPNDLLWGFTCEGPASKRAEIRPVCAEMAATFRPLPAVSG